LAQISFPLPMASFYDSYAKNSWALRQKNKKKEIEENAEKI